MNGIDWGVVVAALVAAGGAYGYWRTHALLVKVRAQNTKQVKPGLQITVANSSAFAVEARQIQVVHPSRGRGAGVPVEISAQADPLPPQTVAAWRGECRFFVPSTALVASRDELPEADRGDSGPVRIEVRVRDQKWVRSNQCQIPQ